MHEAVAVFCAQVGHCVFAGFPRNKTSGANMQAYDWPLTARANYITSYARVQYRNVFFAVSCMKSFVLLYHIYF